MGVWGSGPDGEFFSLTYCRPDQRMSAAVVAPLVGPTVKGVVPVEVVLPARKRKRDELVAAAVGEEEFSLLEKGEEKPWPYAQYHATTGANMYSDAHWGFYTRGTYGKPRAEGGEE